MKNMYTKKSVLVWSVVLSLLPGFLLVTKRYDYKNLFLASFVFLLVFLFSLITYFLPEAVFRAWARFTTWWIPLQILAVVLTPESSGGFFVSILDKQLAAIILSGLFVLISLLIVAWKYFVFRRKT